MEVTTVAAQGEAEASFDRAGFAIRLVATSSSVNLAKQSLSAAITELNTNLNSLKSDLSLEFVKNSVRSSSHVQETYNYNRETQENEFAGYQITYSMSFEVSDLGKVNQVYDTLTSLDSASDTIKMSVSSPSFSLKNHDRLNNKALKNAFRKVKDRFDAECEVLGLDPLTFEIATWEASYSDSQRSAKVAGRVGAVRALSAHAAPMMDAADSIDSPMGGSAITFNAGLATVTVNLEVGFQRKAQ